MLDHPFEQTSIRQEQSSAVREFPEGDLSDSARFVRRPAKRKIRRTLFKDLSHTTSRNPSRYETEALRFPCHLSERTGRQELVGHLPL
jgi:hypothetical protein